MLQCSVTEALRWAGLPDQGPRDPGGLAERCPFSSTTTTQPLQSRPSLAPEAAFLALSPAVAESREEEKSPGLDVQWSEEER